VPFCGEKATVWRMSGQWLDDCAFGSRVRTSNLA
jgi:hypothetical protein